MIELSPFGQRMAIRAARKLFDESIGIPDRMPERETTLEQRIDDTGSEVALVQMLLTHPGLPLAYRDELEAWDPIQTVNTYGDVPDIAVGRGIDVRHRHGSRFDDLILRRDDHRERIWAQMIGYWPIYEFAGFVLPAKLGDLTRFRKTYGKKHLEPVSGLPWRVRNFLLADLIRAL
ncbi:MAG TPA: hypothetical protein VF760_02085 [Xanthobacteraceae bacterium]